MVPKDTYKWKHTRYVHGDRPWHDRFWTLNESCLRGTLLTGDAPTPANSLHEALLSVIDHITEPSIPRD
jgi:hypothetical protein